MARPTPYSRPHTSNVGLKSASHIARSRLAASAQQKTVRDWTPPMFRSLSLPKTPSPEETRTASNYSPEVPATNPHRAHCKRKRGQGSTNEAKQKLLAQNEELIIQYERKNRQLREQLKQQEQSHWEDTQKNLRKLHGMSSSVGALANSFQSGRVPYMCPRCSSTPGVRASMQT